MNHAALRAHATRTGTDKLDRHRIDMLETVPIYARYDSGPDRYVLCYAHTSCQRCSVNCLRSICLQTCSLSAGLASAALPFAFLAWMLAPFIRIWPTDQQRNYPLQLLPTQSYAIRVYSAVGITCMEDKTMIPQL